METPEAILIPRANLDAFAQAHPGQFAQALEACADAEVGRPWMVTFLVNGDVLIQRQVPGA